MGIWRSLSAEAMETQREPEIAIASSRGMRVMAPGTSGGLPRLVRSADLDQRIIEHAAMFVIGSTAGKAVARSRLASSAERRCRRRNHQLRQRHRIAGCSYHLGRFGVACRFKPPCPCCNARPGVLPGGSTACLVAGGTPRSLIGLAPSEVAGLPR